MPNRISAIMVVLIALLVSMASPLKAAMSTAGILLQDSSARIAGLGGSASAWQGSSDMILDNPAGISRIGHSELKFLHTRGIESLSTEILLASVPLSGLGVFGAQVLQRSAPDIDNEGASDAKISNKDMVFGAALGIPFGSRLSLGIQAKVVRQLLGSFDVANLAIDMGGQYQLNEKWRLAMSLRNLGPDVEWNTAADPMPAALTAGVHTLLYKKEQYNWQTGMDIRYLIPDQIISLYLGTEIIVQDTITMRMGIKISGEENVSSFYAGTGFNFKIARLKMTLDFTFSPEMWDENNMELKNLVSLTVLF